MRNKILHKPRILANGGGGGKGTERNGRRLGISRGPDMEFNKNSFYPPHDFSTCASVFVRPTLNLHTVIDSILASSKRLVDGVVFDNKTV